MAGASDITKLFKSFGGDAAGEYREIVDHDRQEASRSRWPILEQIPLNGSTPRQAADQPSNKPASAPTKDIPSFHSLRVQAPAAVSRVPSPPVDSGSLNGLLKRLAQPAEQVAVAAESTSLFKKQSSAPQGMSSVFQRLRRP